MLSNGYKLSKMTKYKQKMPTMPSKFKNKEHTIILLYKNHGKCLRKMGKIHCFLGLVILNALGKYSF